MNQEAWRKKNFLAKFQAAAAELNANSHRDIESLKFRDSSSYHDYHNLLAELSPLKVIQVQGNYQGRTWKLTDTENNSVIIVEHETGLEILYVVGAIASIASLIPLVVNIWNRMRDICPPHRGHFGSGAPEKRRFDKKDRLIEEPAPPVETIVFQYLINQYDSLRVRISSLEADVSNLKERGDGSQKNGIKRKKAKTGTGE